ncbi:DUF6965 family protein [Sphingobacterium yanglingense]|uniref:DUF6965 domain-containing protein n=1 Tax=Sphingobacterium yanglingense TaxID=1437280 RepID=A0A4R6WLD7_9SPHI|nr:hypothetical protein [Sphingobacterium yanglingense]TDQ79598.1 hypothetical protein CLV99_1043 [Sphingobacterium yanglingense]
MTVEDLKNELLGKEYPEVVQVGAHQKVVDVAKFLEIQFLECELWKKKDITKCPAHYRLMQFYEATRNIE